MDENHQNVANSHPITTENKIWLPPSFINNKAPVAPTSKARGIDWGFGGRSVWDWLNLIGVLAVPFVVAGATLLITLEQAQLSNAAAEKQHETDIHIAQEQQQEATLENYLKNIKDLLLNQGLGNSDSSDAVRQVARIETLTALERLDSHRKGILLKFLYQANLITFPTQGIPSLVGLPGSIIDMSQADLSMANLGSEDLDNVNIYAGSQEVNCIAIPAFVDEESSQVKLGQDQLFSVGNSSVELLSDTSVKGIALNNTNLNGINMNGTHLSFADINHASLENADLSSSQLICADLTHSDLKRANLSQADLDGAYLMGADLSHANLFKAEVSSKQLAEAASLTGAIMPDGSIHP